MAKEKAVIRSDMSRFKWTLNEIRKNKVGYFMAAPFFILFFIFTVLPVVLSFLLSFTTFDLLNWPKFVFMDNYIRLFLDDDIFLLAIKNTLIFAGITGPVSYLLSLLFAWFINELSPRVRKFVTLIFYAPSISGNVYIIWTILFSGDQYGPVNGFLIDIGMINSAKSGTLTLSKLEAMTAVCSVGIDMVAIPGDTPASTISALIADEMAIGMVNNKTTAVRIIPVPGKTVGEYVEFGGLLGRAPIMPVMNKSAEKFINRGGRIPAPIHGNKN